MTSDTVRTPGKPSRAEVISGIARLRGLSEDEFAPELSSKGQYLQVERLAEILNVSDRSVRARCERSGMETLVKRGVEYVEVNDYISDLESTYTSNAKGASVPRDLLGRNSVELLSFPRTIDILGALINLDPLERDQILEILRVWERMSGSEGGSDE